MSVEVVIPSPGESITEVTLGQWLCNDGDWARKTTILWKLNPTRSPLKSPPRQRRLRITAEAGAEMEVGDIVATIDTDATAPSDDQGSDVQAADPGDSGAGQCGRSSNGGCRRRDPSSDQHGRQGCRRCRSGCQQRHGHRGPRPSDQSRCARGLHARSHHPQPAQRTSRVRRPAFLAIDATGTRGVRREKMSRLRARIAEPLGGSPANRRHVDDLQRSRHERSDAAAEIAQRSICRTARVGLGFMSLFVKACCEALRRHEGINAYIDGQEVEYHDYCDVSVAVGTPKGLVVPVLRNADRLSFAEIERGIKDLAIRA